jgi:small subunit ribosomal protein S11
MSKKDSKKKRTVVVTPICCVYIYTTYNNMILTITNDRGDVICWSSSGKNGFKNTKKKNTPYAGQLVANDCAKQALDYKVKMVDVFVQGPGTGREMAIRSLAENGLEILSITDITKVPHGGCRSSKRRRN